MTPTDKPAPLSLPERLVDLQKQHAQLSGMHAQLEQQRTVVRDQLLRCEGAIQVVQTLIDETKATPPAPAPKADPAPSEPASS